MAQSQIQIPCSMSSTSVLVNDSNDRIITSPTSKLLLHKTYTMPENVISIISNAWDIWDVEITYFNFAALNLT